ncbi:hypothetical protein C7B61_06360, partial [filamentous cyanobacterium CCP1]
MPIPQEIGTSCTLGDYPISIYSLHTLVLGELPGASPMTFSSTQTLTFDQFIAQYGDAPRYELADGEVIDREPTGPHEAVGGKLAAQISMAIAQAQSPWFIP